MKFCERVKTLKSILFVMYLVGFTIAIPSAVIPGLQQGVFGDDAFIITGAFAAVKGVLGFIYVPLLGSFTDRFGRKVPLVVVLSLSVIPYAIMLFSNFWAYSIANCVLGMWDAVMTILLTMATDKTATSVSVRTEAFALVMASFFFGISTGPFMGAFLTQTQTFISCAVVQLLTALISYRIFDDEGPKRMDSKLVSLTCTEGGACDTTAVAVCPITQIASTLTSNQRAGVVEIESPVEPEGVQAEEGTAEEEEDKDKKTLVFSPEKQLEYSRCVYRRVVLNLYQSRNLRMMATVIFWNALAEQVFDKLLLLYLQEDLMFNSTEQAIVIAILGVGALIGLLVVTPALKQRFGIKRTLSVGLAGNMVVAMLYAFARAHWIFFGATSFSVVGMTVFPCAVAMATKSVDEDAVGIAQGLATGSRMLAGAISPLLFGFIFNATQHSMVPGCAFVCAAMCIKVALVITHFVKTD